MSVAFTHCRAGTRSRGRSPQPGRSVSTGRPDPKIGVRPTRNSEAIRSRYLGVFPKLEVAFRVVIIRFIDSLVESLTCGRQGVCVPHAELGGIALSVSHGSEGHSFHNPDDWHVLQARCQTRNRREKNLRQRPYNPTHHIVAQSVVSDSTPGIGARVPLAVSAMPFTTIGAIPIKTSRKRKILIRRGRIELRRDLALTVVRTIASTAVRHANAKISSDMTVATKLIRLTIAMIPIGANAPTMQHVLW